MNGDGLKLVIIGVVLAIVSTLFEGLEFTLYFWTDTLIDYFTDIADVFTDLIDDFSTNIFWGLWALAVLIFLIGLLLSLIGMKNFASFFGGLLLLYIPIILIVEMLVDGFIADILSLDYLSTFLLLAGGILVLIGGIKNKE